MSCNFPGLHVQQNIPSQTEPCIAANPNICSPNFSLVLLQVFPRTEQSIQDSSQRINSAKLSYRGFISRNVPFLRNSPNSSFPRREASKVQSEQGRSIETMILLALHHHHRRRLERCQKVCDRFWYNVIVSTFFLL